MRTIVLAGMVGLSIFAASPAHADPSMNCGYVAPCGPIMPNPGPWNGQLQPTWNVPNWGGLSSPPAQCWGGTCQGVIQNPNGPWNFVNPNGPVL